MIKIVISDLDGTLLHHGDNYSSEQISHRNIEAIKQLQLKGIEFAIATGRGMGYKSHVEKQLNQKINYVGHNGQEVVLQDDKLIKNDKFSIEELFFVATRLKDIPLNFNILTEDDKSQLYMFNKEVYPFVCHSEVLRDRSFCHNMLPLDSIKGRTDLKFGRMSLLVEPNQMEELKSLIEPLFNGEYDIFSSDIDFIDFAKPNSNKGQGVKCLIDHLGINEDEVAIIGDEENDISMFKLTNNSYCMEHAKEHIKAKANYSVKSVADMIDDLLK